jgi:hypothetical protein
MKATLALLAISIVALAIGERPARAQSAATAAANHALALNTSADAMSMRALRRSSVNLRIPPHGLARARTHAAPKIPVVTSLPILPSGAGNNLNFSNFTSPSLNAYTSEFLYDTLFDSVFGCLPGQFCFTFEPPDQGLCVGNGKVVELVNNAIAIFDTNGNPLSGPTDLNSFFNATPGGLNSISGTLDFISDPRCYYDPPTNTFFLSVTDLGDFAVKLDHSALLLAVMPGGANAPAAVYVFHTEDDGKSTTIKHKHCPCFEDQPLLGGDTNAIYISGNEFKLKANSKRFNGAQIYAFSKADLVALNPTPGQQIFEAGTVLLADTANDLDVAASVQPAVATDGIFATNNNGTEYFMSALDFPGTRDNRIGVWALINTCGLPSVTSPPICGAIPSLINTIVTSNAYGVPPNANQPENGFTPLGVFCGLKDERNLVTGDDRMQQVTFADGNLYSAVTTVLKVSKKKQAGLLYFVVAPSVAGGTLGASITDSNYVATAGLHLFYPSVAATQTGAAAMTFSFAGGSTFPSVGYIPLPGAGLGAFEIHTAIDGVGIYDGESGYPRCSGASAARWGDYSAAAATGDTLWMASEYVSATCNHATWSIDATCGNTRGAFSNLGTLISNLVPPGGP